jgi:hypothetical protein
MHHGTCGSKWEWATPPSSGSPLPIFFFSAGVRVEPAQSAGRWAFKREATAAVHAHASASNQCAVKLKHNSQFTGGIGIDHCPWCVMEC